jgi:hypothetical protein
MNAITKTSDSERHARCIHLPKRMRWEVRALAAVTVVILTAATSVLAKRGDVQDMLLAASGCGLTNNNADSCDYGVTTRLANGGDYVVTNGNG